MRKSALIYACTIMTCLAGVFFVLKLWQRDLTVPFVYVEDGLGPLVEIKTLKDGQDIYHYNFYNAPYTYEESALYGVKGYNLFLPVFRFLLLFTDEIGLVVNIFYLSTYPLTAAAMLLVLRRIHVFTPVAIAGSILYAFLPYHFLRSEMHLFVGTYLFIPLVTYGIIQLYRNSLGSETADVLIITAGCILLGASDIYYSFFAAILICFAGGVSCIRDKSCKNLIYTIGLLLCLIIPILINSWPAISHFESSDIHIFANNRSLWDIDRYGIRISQLLMPITGHRLNILAKLRDTFNGAGFEYLLETNMNSLGLYMSAGFLTGIWILFLGNTKKNDNNGILMTSAKINLFVILLASIGGFNIFVGMFVTYYIRAYCRIVVFIAAFANIIIGLCLTGLVEKCKGNDNSRIRVLAGILSVFILIPGILDQTSEQYATGTDFNYVSTFEGELDELEEQYKSDKKFVKQIEQLVGPEQMIYELPFLSAYEMENNVFHTGQSHVDRLLRPYLHSDKLYWSYPYVGRSQSLAGKLNIDLGTIKLKEQVKAIAWMGFSGIYLDSYSFSKTDLKKTLTQIGKLTGANPIMSEQKDLYFFSLLDYREELREKLTEKEWQAEQDYWKYEFDGAYSARYGVRDLYFKRFGVNKKRRDGLLRKGELQFGPYATLSPGNYKITVKGEGMENASPSCTAGFGKDDIAISNLKRESEMLTYEISLSKTTEAIEYLIKNRTEKEINIKSITIDKINGTAYEFDARDLFYEDVSGKKITDSSQAPKIMEQGELQFGPYVSLDEGQYVIIVTGSGLTGGEVYSQINAGETSIKVNMLEERDDRIIYNIKLKEPADDIEFLMRNRSEDTMKLDSIKVIQK